MRLPKLSSAVARRASTTAGRSAGRVSAQEPVLPCGAECDPNDNQCGALCPNCLLDPQTGLYTCQK